MNKVNAFAWVLKSIPGRYVHGCLPTLHYRFSPLFLSRSLVASLFLLIKFGTKRRDIKIKKKNKKYAQTGWKCWAVTKEVVAYDRIVYYLYALYTVWMCASDLVAPVDVFRRVLIYFRECLPMVNGWNSNKHNSPNINDALFGRFSIDFSCDLNLWVCFLESFSQIPRWRELIVVAAIFNVTPECCLATLNVPRAAKNIWYNDVLGW